MRDIYNPEDKIEIEQKKIWGNDEISPLIIIFIAFYVFISVIVPNFLFLPRIVEGRSMEPTLENGDVVMLYLQGDIDYGDIIVLHAEGIHGGEDIIKRVIGKPGDTIGFSTSANGYNVYRKHYIESMEVKTILENEYYITPSNKEKPTDQETTLGKDEYYVMGDNRDDSTDSRDSKVGKVNISDVRGKVLFIIRDSQFLWVKRPIY